MKSFQEKECSRCGYRQMKSWAELTDEQKLLVERLPLSAEFSSEQRKRHRFCPRCWHEQISNGAEIC